ncbi:MAG: mechanosensitive ion channel family protein [Thiovulaceae bacterium]|nr:mechanosensitive ion channel family protein [Sulfurimonadaceae bacterium]
MSEYAMIYEILATALVTVVAIFGRRVVKKLLHKRAVGKKSSTQRIYYIVKVFDLLFLLVILLAYAFIWSVDFKGLSVVASSVFAIIGVAMFAQWSILSNISASIIIFFNFPARIGDKIRIIDSENSVEGTIKEITLFQMELIDQNGNIILYPNNLILQKPVIKIVD